MANFVSLPPASGETFYQNSVDVFLTSSETYVFTKDYGRINLYSDSNVASNRQILLAPSDLEGQQITLIMLSDDPNTCLLSTLSTSYVRLESSWTPMQYDQLTLQWTKGLWIEVNRSASGSGGFNPVITNPQDKDIIYYNGSNWINSNILNTVNWQPINSYIGWTSAAYVGVYLNSLLLFRGVFVAGAAPDPIMGTLPASIPHPGYIATVPAYRDNSGLTVITPIVFSGNTIGVTDTVFQNDLQYIDGVVLSIYT